MRSPAQIGEGRLSLGQGISPLLETFRGEAVIFWVGVDLCIYFDDSKSLPLKGLHA